MVLVEESFKHIVWGNACEVVIKVAMNGSFPFLV